MVQMMMMDLAVLGRLHVSFPGDSKTVKVRRSGN